MQSSDWLDKNGLQKHDNLLKFTIFNCLRAVLCIGERVRVTIFSVCPVRIAQMDTAPLPSSTAYRGCCKPTVIAGQKENMSLSTTHRVTTPCIGLGTRLLLHRPGNKATTP